MSKYKYFTDGTIIKASADYDEPRVRVMKNSLQIAEIPEELDYKMTLYVMKNNKIYKEKIVFNDDNLISVQSKVVYSF